MKTFTKYRNSFVQVVRLNKSEVFFIRNVCDEDKDMIQSEMRVKTMTSHSKYMGLLVMFGRSKKKFFSCH